MISQIFLQVKKQFSAHFSFIYDILSELPDENVFVEPNLISNSKQSKL